MEPYRYFHGKPWWEVADMSQYEDDEQEKTEEEKNAAGNTYK